MKQNYAEFSGTEADQLTENSCEDRSRAASGEIGATKELPARYGVGDGEKSFSELLANSIRLSVPVPGM